jgi:RNA polymerase sigma-70 factor, ECF subfamily
MDELTRLALAAGDGDRQALASFIRMSQAEVWRLCAHLVDRSDADDLTQEVYLRAVPALTRFRGDSSARTWLLTIARRTCADSLRRTIRRRRLSERLMSATTVESQLEPDASSAGGELDGLIAALDPDRRVAFVMTQLLGLSYAEVAEICEVPIGTVRSRVSRARQELVVALGDGDEWTDVAAE